MEKRTISSYHLIAALAFGVVGIMHAIQFVLHMEFKFDTQEFVLCLLHLIAGVLLFLPRRDQLFTAALIAIAVFGFATTSVRLIVALSFVVLAVIYANIVKKEKREEAPDRTGMELTWLIYAGLLALPSLIGFLSKLFSMKTWNNSNEPFLLVVMLAQTVGILSATLYAAFPGGTVCLTKRGKK